MENLATYFDNIPTSHRTILLVGGLMIFWIIEGILPSTKTKYNRNKHALVNLFFTLTTLIVNLLFAFIIVKSSDYVNDINFGLLHIFDLPLWTQLVFGLLLLDLVGAYLIHWIEHKIPLLWKFHAIHHTDLKVDTTTALRHHPGESVFRAIFTILALFVSGAPMWIVMIYQSLSALMSQFNHANLKLSKSLDVILRSVFVTPNMHRIHHHFERPITDTNYGNIFSFWDRIFGTYHDMPVSEVQFGLDVYDGNTQNIGQLLKVPFDRKGYR